MTWADACQAELDSMKKELAVKADSKQKTKGKMFDEITSSAEDPAITSEHWALSGTEPAEASPDQG